MQNLDCVRLWKLKKPSSRYLGQTTEETIFLSPTIVANIESIIAPKNIPRKILKEFKTNLSEPLSNVVNVSFNKGTFPDSLKVANVIPIHKKVKNETVIITDPSIYYPM